jgi:hypothetical protein
MMKEKEEKMRVGGREAWPIKLKLTPSMVISVMTRIASLVKWVITR